MRVPLSPLGIVKRVYIIFRLLLVLAAGTVVVCGWLLVERNDNYRIGYPSPRTYLALSSARYVDASATHELRKRAADQIVEVRVRDDKNTQQVRQHIAELRKTGTPQFISNQLADILENFSEKDRKEIISAVIDISEKIYEHAISREEITAQIWQNLQKSNLDQAKRNVVFQIIDSMMIPTLENDNEMKDQLRTEVSQRIPPVVREVRLGGAIVQTGQIVTEQIAELLRSQGYPDAAFPWKQLAFILIVTTAWAIWLTWVGDRQGFDLSDKDWFCVALLLLVDWGAQTFFSRWGVDSLSLLALNGWLFLTMPHTFAFHVALGGGLIGYLLAFPGMTSNIAVGCVVSGVSAGVGYLFFKDAASRIAIWRSLFGLGLCLTLTSSLVSWGFGLALTAQGVGVSVAFCALWSSLVIALLPLWEALFEIISPLRLLELSHPSQPLLKRLQLEAPGTYHHVITVGTLVEAVCDRMNVNGLLAKAGAYYHDIGKLRRPRFFIENQLSGENVHDEISPLLSAHIIISHVKDGLELAEEYKLPRTVRNFIAEHHGTTLLIYFYKKALALDENADVAEFTYPGPRPQSRETALLMLADSIEAAMKMRRGSSTITHEEIEHLVEGVVNSKILEHQFEDVDFTMKEIAEIKNVFNDVLRSMYHSREVKDLPDADIAAIEEELR